MSWYSNYINNISQSNEDYYREQTQSWIDDTFEDTTLLRTIQEEKFPFAEEYEDYQVQIDSVAEITVNITKVIGDFISVLFRDCSHTNYRGQKYIYDNETYLCYDKINKLSKVAKAKLIRCNNSINWLSEDNKVLSEKVFCGYEITSTNDSVGKGGIVSNRRILLYMQYNDKTKSIKVNQRFMFQHSQCFRVEEIDNYNIESGLDEPTMIRMYLVYSASLPTDNKELNICDYYSNDYSVKIDQGDIVQKRNSSGVLTCTITEKGKPTEQSVIWTSNNNNVNINANGSFTVAGSVGQSSIITCQLESNPNIQDSIKIDIVSDYLQEKKIIISPMDITELTEDDTVNFECGIYIESSKQIGTVSCTPNWIGDSYTLTETINGYKLTNNHIDQRPLILTFSANGCEDVSITINLVGLF